MSLESPTTREPLLPLNWQKLCSSCPAPVQPGPCHPGANRDVVGWRRLSSPRPSVPAFRACLITLRSRRVRPRGLQLPLANTVTCRPGALTGPVFNQALALRSGGQAGFRRCYRRALRAVHWDEWRCCLTQPSYAFSATAADNHRRPKRCWSCAVCRSRGSSCAGGMTSNHLPVRLVSAGWVVCRPTRFMEGGPKAAGG
jgi:hypothetical protein